MRDERYKPGRMYYVDGASLNGLWKIAAKLCCGDKLSDMQRRDMGQWMQAHIEKSIEAEDIPA
jgi:hypothetical protein